jgi:hypothetical protein
VPSNPLLGTWRLISFHLKDSDGRLTYPWGPNVTGFITYTDYGRMSVVFAKADRPRRPSEDWWGGSVEDKAVALDTFAAYAGTYDYDGEKVTHHVEVCSFQNKVGGDLVRLVRLERNQVSLDTPPTLLGGKMQTAYLVWERV